MECLEVIVKKSLKATKLILKMERKIFIQMFNSDEFINHKGKHSIFGIKNRNKNGKKSKTKERKHSNIE